MLNYTVRSSPVFAIQANGVLECFYLQLQFKYILTTMKLKLITKILLTVVSTCNAGSFSQGVEGSKALKKSLGKSASIKQALAAKLTSKEKPVAPPTEIVTQRGT
jgi:hypothetical protein